MHIEAFESALRDAIGDIEELEHLGKGSQGLVWRVRQGGRDDAVKVLPNADFARVAREIEGLKAVSSPHVMKFQELLVIESNGSRWPAIRGEFIAGGTIADKLDSEQWPSRSDALACALGILHGLRDIHAVDLVHRDVKDLNVALRDGQWDQAVVLDLGLVRDLAARSITQYPSVLGTIPFMAPEQLRGERAVQRTDVFGVGALLFLLLTKELPYVSHEDDQGLDGEELRAVMLPRTESDDWPRWARYQNELDEDLASLLSRLVAKEPYERPRIGDAISLVTDILAPRT